jgi:hypothetical protein
MRQTIRVVPAAYATDLSSRWPFATAAGQKVTLEAADGQLGRVSAEDKTYELAKAASEAMTPEDSNATAIRTAYRTRPCHWIFKVSYASDTH